MSILLPFKARIRDMIRWYQCVAFIYHFLNLYLCFWRCLDYLERFNTLLNTFSSLRVIKSPFYSTDWDRLSIWSDIFDNFVKTLYMSWRSCQKWWEGECHQDVGDILLPTTPPLLSPSLSLTHCLTAYICISTPTLLRVYIILYSSTYTHGGGWASIWAYIILYIAGRVSLKYKQIQCHIRCNFRLWNVLISQ